MPEQNNNEHNAQVMHMLGQLTGEVRTMHTGMTARMQDIKDEIKRLEAAQNERMARIEDGLGRRIDNLETTVGKRIDGLGSRVTALEAEDKRIIEKTARFSALGGGIGGTLVAVAAELLKHIR